MIIVKPCPRVEIFLSNGNVALNNSMLRKLIIITVFCIASNNLACRQSPKGVIFWPANTVRKSAADYRINASDQLRELREANPTNDAQEAFKAGDFRFLADRPVMPRILGVPYDEIVRSSSEHYGLKIIAFSEDMLTNQEFFTLKVSYNEKYNLTMYNLITSSKKNGN